MRKILLSMVLLLTATGVFAETNFVTQFSEGKDYKAVTPQETSTKDKIEVLEFFWYGCPHCYTFDPFVSKWTETKPANVVFIRVPTVFRPDWKVHARTYYALEELGSLEKLHTKIFEEIHKNKKHLSTVDAMTDFLVAQGVDKKAFTEAYNSFSVDTSMRNAIKLQTAFHIEGVPTVIINGKYATSGSMAGTYERVLEVVNYLIEKERTK